MKKKLKKGSRSIETNSQERSVLIGVINEYIDSYKKRAMTNHIIKRQITYLEKTLGKLLMKKRCTHCGNWI